MLSQNASSNSLFDWVLQDKGGRRTTAFLQKMEELVPWKEISDEIEGAVYDGHMGRPGFPVHVLLKALFLELWYGLSDPELEEQVLDRVSFQRFLGVRNRRDIPDETTVCRFRGKLVELNAEKELFEFVQRMIDERGLRLNRGTIVDATIVDAPRGRKREDKSDTKDPDATFTKKNGKSYHGYKVHVATDTDGNFVNDMIVTTANVQDREAFDDLTKNEKNAVFADKAYVLKKKKQEFRARSIYWGVLDKAERNRPLTKNQEELNRRKSSVRCHIEHVFAWTKQLMKARTVRFRGLRKNNFHWTLVIAAYNLRRMVSVISPS